MADTSAIIVSVVTAKWMNNAKVRGHFLLVPLDRNVGLTCHGGGRDDDCKAGRPEVNRLA